MYRDIEIYRDIWEYIQVYVGFRPKRGLDGVSDYRLHKLVRLGVAICAFHGVQGSLPYRPERFEMAMLEELFATFSGRGLRSGCPYIILCKASMHIPGDTGFFLSYTGDTTHLQFP